MPVLPERFFITKPAVTVCYTAAGVRVACDTHDTLNTWTYPHGLPSQPMGALERSTYGFRLYLAMPARPSPESRQSQAEMRLCGLAPIESPPIVMPRLEIETVVTFFKALSLFGLRTTSRLRRP